MSTATAFVEGLLAGRATRPARALDWLDELRGEALDRAHALTLPTTRDEDWRFTDLSALYALAFKQPVAAPRLDASAIEPFVAPEARARLVFVDGQFAPALSRTAAAGAVVVSELGAVLAAGTDVRGRLAQLADYRDDAFRAINTAHLGAGAVVVAGRGAAPAAPVEVLFVATQAGVATHPRVLVIVEAGADLHLLERYETLVDGVYCTNGVTEIAVGAGARVRHERVQRESGAAFHIATNAVRLDRDAAYACVAVSLGARISRYNLNVVQAGEGAAVELDGLALIGDRQLADTHSFLDHAQPHGTSRQLHKCVAGDRSHAVFNGRILVRAGAQLTNSAQQSRNLLLSRGAHVDTKPQLEIFADDVKCAHGATVGQLEAEELFYLQSRGLSAKEARGLLTYGFAADIVARIKVPSLAASLRREVLAHTAKKESA